MMRTLLLLPLAGCMSLDGLVIPGDPRDEYDLSSDVIPAELIEEVSFEAPDGTTLYGVWARQSATEDRPPLIWIHGNGGALDRDFHRVEYYWAWGDWDVFAVDYRGYGKSDGPATRDGILEIDGRAAVEFVADTRGVEASTIPWIGLSLGAAVAAHTSDEVDAHAIVLESMFPSTDMLLDDGSGLDLPTGWFFTDTWDNVDAVSRSRSPIFVIHGKADDFIDGRYGQDVYDAAPDPKRKWFPDGVGHSDAIEVEPDAYEQRVRAFFADPLAEAE